MKANNNSRPEVPFLKADPTGSPGVHKLTVRLADLKYLRLFSVITDFSDIVVPLPIIRGVLPLIASALCSVCLCT